MIKVNILSESGYIESLLGLGLSHGITMDYTFEEFASDRDLVKRMSNIANKLAFKGKGESKFLETINVIVDVTAPIYFWQEFDTYRVGISKQSSSTMHTLLKENDISSEMIDEISKDNIFDEILEDKIKNYYLACESIIKDIKNSDMNIADKKRFAKKILPSTWKQRRIISTNYKTLQNIYQQRENHQLVEWREFCQYLKYNLKHTDYIDEINK
jgi:hypothetical protein